MTGYGAVITATMFGRVDFWSVSTSFDMAQL
jgi:hypothetical protein